MDSPTTEPNMLTKSNHNAIATNTNKPCKGIKVKKVLLIDSGDGCFTDASVKVKEYRGDASRMVLKCTSYKRLMQALADAGLKGKVIKGNKHYIAFVGTEELQHALSVGSQAQALPGNSHKLLK